MNKVRHLFLSAFVLLLGVSVAPAQQAPGKAAYEVEVAKDVVYGKGGATELKLDIAMPVAKNRDQSFPTIVCIHGGGWRGGKRQDLTSTIQVLAGRGYVAASISYRLVPTTFPAQIEDSKAALRYLRANTGKYRIRSDRIAAMGFSAGGHLACLLGTTDKNDGLEGSGGNPDQSSRVQAVVSFFGPTDFTDGMWSEEVEKVYLRPFLGDSFAAKPELYKRASSILYATKDDPPHLFFHGTVDPLVGIHHSRRLAEKLRGLGVEATVIEVEGEGHGWRDQKLRASIEQMIAFLDKQLQR